MTRRSIQSIVAVAAALLAAVASAQQGAPASPAPAAGPAPQHSCGKPGEFPGNLASDTQKRTWQKDYVAYVDCLKKFVTDEQAIADPHIKAANAAINEYNAAVKAYNEQIEKAKGN